MCASGLPLHSYNIEGVRFDLPFDEKTRKFIGTFSEINAYLAIHFVNCLEYTKCHSPEEISQWLHNAKYLLLDGAGRLAETSDLVSRGLLPESQTIPIGPVFPQAYFELIDTVNGILFVVHIYQLCVLF